MTEIKLDKIKEPYKKDLFASANKIIRLLMLEKNSESNLLKEWLGKLHVKTQYDYSSHLYSESKFNPSNIPVVNAIYDENSEMVDGRIVLRENFRKILENHDNVVIFGQDSGKIGGVNQGLEGLQDIFGESRVFDTGIREATIIGQGIGLSLRGLRPIAEIQYLDYLLYSIQILSDDLATLHYRTRGKQKAPLIVRTRGHRLEGIWHSGSPMGGMINLLRGIYLLVPRNMTIAAGFYNALLKGDQPAIVVECLNGYRTKEKIPNNIGEFTVQIGRVEKIKTGSDITVVSYGSTLKIVEKAATELEKFKFVQNNILLNAAKLCKVGGKIVYITCSLLYDENEFQIKAFLNNCKNFEVINFREDIKKYLKKEIFKYNKFGLTLTPDVLNTDGYFISLLKKTA